MSFAARKVLITGGAGFIGTNLADSVLHQGGEVVVLDDLSRVGVRDNLQRLSAMHPGPELTVHVGDVRDARTVREAMADVDAVFHFAAQVAVTTSVDEPRHDFEVNLGGTVTVLEEIRRLARRPSLLFTSTNKVYGGMNDVAMECVGGRYQPTDTGLRDHGISEARPLDFCSPYGCSKGGADQYVLDYATTYGISATTFRMSCIYGPHQCGNEDQGWVAHFLVQAMADRGITIFGDGRQVRDALFVDDLVDAMDVVLNNAASLSGRAFNMGGGVGHTISLLELLDIIETLEGRAPTVDFGDWRIGDQRWYVSDTSEFQRETGWSARVGVREGVGRLHRWLGEQRVITSLADAS
ncbi:MAG: CDP-tyvelose-2-epimerase (CDP-paratose 2-epimerase)-like protein [Ilumatobacteraceae bacterium]|nr:CDP-tyvelose-2-epimerase (CDP-paratose 2-epimerase)-like protein [Ilumatobacteraceae bacterium]